MNNPDLDPTPEARIAMMIWSNEYAFGSLGSMGFWKSLPMGRKRTCYAALADVAKAAISHGRTLDSLASGSLP
ncbi:hypothetical protein LB559_09040 [Mesorhizobium sp. BR1-1-3]|uniref:hypothetical protein n=1 Tax=Mesorhizobium sp. BR1-1-3 TaxID=2876651 RepID=UPI001CD11D51|nr:hypothetical protein [Mesorhizobium sp. BR1-1-3]MBZ9888083.1 hypothetical protein [Mesorhizobium sp. BR1-1-3]